MREESENVMPDFIAMKQKGEPFVIRCTAHAPYDGCFYEPNYYLYDPQARDAKLVPIYGPGGAVMKGVNEHNWTGQEQQDHMINTLCTGMMGDLWQYDEFDFYPVDDELHEHIDEHFWRAFAMRCDGFTFKCPKCEQTIECDNSEGYDVEYGGYTGNGGIGVFMQDVMCSECYSLGTCGWCGEYCGEDEKKYDYCEWCMKEKMTEEQEEQADQIDDQMLRVWSDLKKITEANPKMEARYKEQAKARVDELEDELRELYQEVCEG